MDLTWSPAEEAFRAEVRSWLAAHVPDPPLPSGDTREGFARHVAWERELFAERWAVVSWPEEYGGRGASLWEWLIFEEEYYRAGAPQRVTQNGIFLLAPTVFEFGTEEQKAAILPRMAAAEDLWCQGWSEPGAGSDLASLTSRAAATGGGWVLNGQKTWTTRGAFCTHLFGLFRSDPSSERHRGLTYFLVPLDAAGVTVRGFGRLDGDEGFAEVFLDDVFVPESAVLGQVNQGWNVAMATTASERGLTLRSPGRFLAGVERLLQLYRTKAAEAPPALRDRVIRAWMDAEAYQLATLQTVTRMAQGVATGAESSMSKIWWSEMDVRLHHTALDLLGADWELDGPWMRGYEFALAGPIYAGTNEIQRNIVAERVLGLPEVVAVRLALTDDQLLFGQAVRDLLAKRCRPELVRASWAAPAPAELASLWSELAGLGVFGILVPEEAGGLGLTELELVAVLEEVGRAAVPLPVLEAATVAIPWLVRARHQAAQAALDGQIVVTASLGPGDLVAGAQLAAVAVVVGDDGIAAVALEPGSFEAVTSVDPSRRLGRLSVPAGSGELLSAELDDAAEAFDRVAFGAAAVLVGLGRHLVEVTVDYVGSRHQFGVPIGSFQAIKHKLADAHIGLEFARPALYQAAYALAEGLPSASRDVSLAKALASEAALVVASTCLQCHGAMGYADEYDLHLWFKRVWALAAAFGDAAWHRDRIGRSLGV